MTSETNLLTKRDIGQLAADIFAPTVSSSELHGLVLGLERLGYDSNALLQDVGLHKSDFVDPDARFHCALHMMIVDRAQRIRPMKNLALHVATQTPIGTYPVVDNLVATSDTVGTGFHQLARYFRLVGAPVDVTVHDTRDPVEIHVSSPPSPFGEEYTVALAVLNFGEETSHTFRPAYVTFAHPLDDASEYERLLGCPIRSAAAWTGLAVSRHAWTLPLRRRDPGLRSVLERHASRVAERRGTSADDFLPTVRRLLVLRVVGQDTRIGAISKYLAVSPRKLQRRLAAAGLTYQGLVNEVKRDTAAELLSDATLSIGEIAYLLGYSERAAFHRAFRRWRGVTPQAFRERVREEPTPKTARPSA